MGGVRVIVIDSRAGRVLGDTRHGAHEHDRAMVDDDEWAWIEQQATGDFDHLVIATSLPFALVARPALPRGVERGGVRRRLGPAARAAGRARRAAPAT